jgi:hypothetical protein
LANAPGNASQAGAGASVARAGFDSLPPRARIKRMGRKYREDTGFSFMLE